MNPLSEVLEQAGLGGPWSHVGLFLAASLVMMWRLEALLAHGLEGTALGTLVMPYCSGLGNLLFVFLVSSKPGQGGEVFTNCLVNNATNLTLVLGIPAVIWGLPIGGGRRPGRGTGRGDATPELSRLSLLLTLLAVLFFSGVAWALASDGRLDAHDGLVLVALFLFWQCFQVFDVLKHNVRTRQRFGPAFYLDAFIVLLGAGGLYASLDWLVAWLPTQEGAFLNARHLGWLSGWLMVIPNALLALFYAARGRPDVAYSSQVGDGHICIPLCLGLSAMLQPVAVPAFFTGGLIFVAAAALAHLGCVAWNGGIGRGLGWTLIAVYAGFLALGLTG